VTLDNIVAFVTIVAFVIGYPDDVIARDNFTTDARQYTYNNSRMTNLIWIWTGA
jgi:hypothetical protein